MTAVKQERVLVLRVRPEYLDSPELREFALTFGVKPGLKICKIKSELSAEVDPTNAVPVQNDTSYMTRLASI
jgi:hypothetical protein